MLVIILFNKFAVKTNHKTTYTVMLDNNIREQIISLINREVVPAVGCTEPMCVSL